MKKYVLTFLQYSQLFKKLTLQEIEKAIGESNCFNIGVILSMLTYYDLNENHLKQKFFDKLITFHPKFKSQEYHDLIDKSVICSYQGLYSLWKHVFAYQSNVSQEDKVDIDHLVFKVMLLTTAIQDYLDGYSIIEENIMYDFLRNLNFNTQENIQNSIARTHYILFNEEIADKLKKTNEFIDYPQKFQLKYGYSLEEYLTVLLGIISFYEVRKEGFNTPWLLSIEEYFSDMSSVNIAKEVIDSLSFTWQEGKKWSCNQLNNQWNFLLFKEKPLLKINDSKVVPISKQFLNEQIFESMFYKIRSCFDIDDLSFNTYFGRPFEAYAQWLIESALDSCRLEYVYIPEFLYSKTSKRSPDIIVKLGNKVLVIEVKSKRVDYLGFAGDDNKKIDKSFEDIVIKPIQQAQDRIVEIITGSHHKEITKDNEFYFMVVTISTFPTIFKFEKDAIHKLMSYSGLNLGGVFHLDIEEFEFLCEIISRNNSKPVFRVLDNKFNKYFEDSFKNFLISSSLHPRKYKPLDKMGKDLFNKAISFLESSKINN